MKDRSVLKPVIFLVGPTASGKSKLALALAKKIKGEIISCDSMQVYRGMDIGTAKPTRRERKEIPHHVIDQISPRREFSVFQHRKLVLRALDRIRKGGRMPILVGGSGLYVKAVLEGLTPQLGRATGLRRQLAELAQDRGVKHLYSMLRKMDPRRARAIHPNDKRRIIRALEILKGGNHGSCRGAGHEIPAPRSGNLRRTNLSEREGLEELGFRPIIFGLERDRKELYARVERRVDQMLERGWLKEVKRLKRRGLSKTARAAIGYEELLDCLDGKLELNEAGEEIKKRTRHLVKKQLTWFRRTPDVQWIRASGEGFVRSAMRTIFRKLGSEVGVTDAS